MSNFIYKNPLSPEQLNGVQSVSRTETFGTNFSVLGVGGFMEVYNISDLYFTIPTGTTGSIEISGNTIPINILIGTGAPFSPNVLTLNSDNISSGRRRLGMLVYVREVDQVYQYDINDYEIIWSAATGATGVGGDTVVFSDFGTTVKSNTAEGINFISAWTANTVDGVSGVTRANAVWKKYYGSNLSITGGSYNAGTGTLTLTNITGGTQNITGFSGGGGGGGITGGTFIYSAQTLELYSSGGTISITGFSDVFVTGGTYSAGTITFTNNSGTTFDVTGLTTGGVSGEYLPLSGGTVTGGTIFTSGVTANTLSSVDYIDFDLTVTATSAVSRLRYDSGEGGLVTTMFGGNVDLKVGQENVAYCYNGDTITLTKGMVVAIIGNQGNKPRIQRAIASAETTSSTALGIVSETIASGNEGFVTTFGNVRGFQITGITPGSYVYLSPTVLGGFTGTQPQAPDHIVALGYVVRTGNTQGEIFVNISNGWELNELHNVRITNPQNNDILQYSAGTSPVWVNTSSPQLSGLTATTISATTYQNLPQDIFVTGGTYTNGEIIFTNNSGSTFTVTGLPIGGPGGQVYYFNLSNTQTPYQEFSPSATTSAEQTSGVSVNSGVTTTIASFQTPNGYPNTTLIPASYWSFYLHSYKENSGASFDIFCEVYLRTTGGTETLLLSTDPAPITSNSPTPSMQLSDGYYSGSSVSESDRIVVKVRATNTGNQTNTVTFFTEGTQHYSYGITPFNNNDILTCETLSGCSIIQTIQSDVSNKVSKSGDTMTGQLNVPTISATTYLNLPTDVFVTGSSYDNANTLTFTNNTGGTFNVSFNTFTGITATTISATTYQNLPSQSGTGVNSLSYSPSTGILTLTKNDSTTLTAGTFTYLTGASYSNNVITLTDNLGSSSVVLINTVTGWTINGDLTVTGTTTSSIISATTYQNLPSFNFAQVDGVTQFSAETNNFINFSGINISITSAATNTLVFSAGTGVTSVSAIAPITSTSGGTPVISTSMSTNRLIGRTTSGSGVMEEISLTTTGTNGNSSLSALTLNVPNYSLNDLGEISISTANAREDDYAPTGWPGTSDRVRVIRIDSTNTNYMMSLGGLASPSAGRIVTIVNNSAANNLIIIENLSTSSLAANRFRMTANMAYFLLPTRSVTFIYDGTYWTQMSASLNMGLDIFDDCTSAAQNAFTVGGSNSVGLAGCATSGTNAAIRAGGDNFGSFDLSTGTAAAGYAFMSMQARRVGGNSAFAVNSTFPYLVVGRISLTQLGTVLQDFQAAIGINGATSVVAAAQAIGYMWYYNGSANAFWDNRSQNTAGTVSTVTSPLSAATGFNILGVYKPGGANIRDAVYFYSTNAVTYSVSSKFVGTAGTYGGNPTFGLISTVGTTAKEIRMDYYGASFNLVR